MPAAGACLQWLAALLCRDERELLATVTDLARLRGPLFLPALTGLGPPEWSSEARGVLAQLERRTSAQDLVRGVLEGIAWSVTRVIEKLEAARGARLERLIVDGGMSQNHAFLELQSALLDRPLLQSRQTEGTALGAALLAGHTLGIYPTLHRPMRTVAVRARVAPDARRQRRRELEQLLGLARRLATCR
ncbi:MAG: FGGY-family carbohydrate kinase [Planctomycetota bacterium]